MNDLLQDSSSAVMLRCIHTAGRGQVIVRVLLGARLAHAQAVRGSQGPAVAAAFLRLMVSVA